MAGSDIFVGTVEAAAYVSIIVSVAHVEIVKEVQYVGMVHNDIFAYYAKGREYVSIANNDAVANCAKLSPRLTRLKMSANLAATRVKMSANLAATRVKMSPNLTAACSTNSFAKIHECEPDGDPLYPLFRQNPGINRLFLIAPPAAGTACTPPSTAA